MALRESLFRSSGIGVPVVPSLPSKDPYGLFIIYIYICVCITIVCDYLFLFLEYEVRNSNFMYENGDISWSQLVTVLNEHSHYLKHNQAVKSWLFRNVMRIYPIKEN